MELFDTAGHLTDAALRAVVNETLDEMGRLEAAEHLSYCDACLVRYTALLADDTLRTPAAPLTPPVLHRIRQRAVRVLASKYVIYGTAACLALVLWGTGVFRALATPPRPAAAAAAQPLSFYSEKADAFLQNLRDSANSGLAALTHSVQPDAAPQTAKEK